MKKRIFFLVIILFSTNMLSSEEETVSPLRMTVGPDHDAEYSVKGETLFDLPETFMVTESMLGKEIEPKTVLANSSFTQYTGFEFAFTHPVHAGFTQGKNQKLTLLNSDLFGDKTGSSFDKKPVDLDVAITYSDKGWSYDFKLPKENMKKYFVGVTVDNKKYFALVNDFKMDIDVTFDAKTNRVRQAKIKYVWSLKAPDKKPKKWKNKVSSRITIKFKNLKKKDHNILLLMSFNIRNGRANDGENNWKKRREAVVNFIKNQQPDILGVQEAYAFQQDFMLKGLVNYKILGKCRDGRGKDEFSSIIYRSDKFKVLKTDTFWLSKTPEKPSTSWDSSMNRVCTWAHFENKKTQAHFYVYNSHFDHRGKTAREESAKLICKRVAAQENKDPAFIMGDFNASEKSKPIAHILSQGFVDTFRQLHPNAREVGTFTGFKVGRTNGGKIDFVFAKKNTTIKEATIHRDQTGKR